jgi:hypothetical protein
MAKYADVSPDTQQLFDKVLESTSIPDYVSFKLLQSETEKNPMKILKANPLVEHLTKFEVVIIVNESFLDDLGEENTEILYDELIAGVFFDNAPKNKIGNSSNSIKNGCDTKVRTCFLMLVNTSILINPFSKRASANSNKLTLGLYTKSFIPTSYLYCASFKNALSLMALPGS